MIGRLDGQDGAIPFVVVGLAALGGVLGLAWAGQSWAQTLLHQAGGELTVWVLRGAFWALDLVALQASMTPVTRDWYTPVLEGVALPIYVLAGLVMVAALIAETIAAMATGNAPRIVQAIFRALIAGMLASAAAALLLTIAGALSELGRIALAASGTSVDAPLLPLQEVLMDTARERDAAPELFVAFLAALVIVFASLGIYFTLAMRPVLLAALIVFLPVAHALAVWTPMRRVQIRVWALAFAVLLAEAAILTMFAVTNTVTGQPEGIDRLIFGTFGLLLAALAPAALARLVGAPELETAVQSMSRGSRMVALGAGALAVKGALMAGSLGSRSSSGAGGAAGGALGAGLAGGGSGPGPAAPTSGPPGGATTGGGSSAVASPPGSRSGGPSATAASAPTRPAGQAGPARADTAAAGPPAPTTQSPRPAGWQSAVTRSTAGTAHG